jgi:hypothetical protein
MSMNITGIGSVLDIGGKIIDRLWPDPAQRDAAKLELFKAQQAGEFKEVDQAFELAKAQIGVNAAEAASPDMFVAGWRPFIGWVCGVGCAWNWVGLPLAVFALAVVGHPVALRPADLSEMMPLLLGMLGIGGLRTVEKLRGVAK